MAHNFNQPLNWFDVLDVLVFEGRKVVPLFFYGCQTMDLLHTIDILKCGKLQNSNLNDRQGP